MAAAPETATDFTESSPLVTAAETTTDYTGRSPVVPAAETTTGSPFDGFKRRVGDNIKLEDVDKLGIHLLLDQLTTDSIKENPNPGVALLSHLQEVKKIGESNVHFIISALLWDDMGPTLNQLAREEFKNFQSATARATLKAETLKSFNFLGYEECYLVARELKLPNTVQEEIKGRDSEYVNILIKGVRDFGSEGAIITSIIESLKRRRFQTELEECQRRIEKRGDNGTSHAETLETFNNLKRDQCLKVAKDLKLPNTVLEEIEVSDSEYVNILIKGFRDYKLEIINMISIIDSLKRCDFKSLAEESEKELKDKACCENMYFDRIDYEMEVVAVKCNICDKEYVDESNNPDSNGGTVLVDDCKYFTQKTETKLNDLSIMYERVTDITELHDADHLVFRRYRILYDHHAILLCKDERQRTLDVINWKMEWPSFKSCISCKCKINCIIRKETIHFPNSGLFRVQYSKEDPPKLVLARAHHQMLKPQDYDVAKNNCETLATYCKTGTKGSSQGILLESTFRPCCHRSPACCGLFQSNTRASNSI